MEVLIRTRRLEQADHLGKVIARRSTHAATDRRGADRKSGGFMYESVDRRSR